jgi:hypothetical protein
MTPEQLKTIRDLRSQGYAVIIWTPEELGDTDPDFVQDMSIQYANEYLIEQIED